MDNWKLPSHLEPYRELIILDCFVNVEQAANHHSGHFSLAIRNQVTLLQRLYDAEKLK